MRCAADLNLRCPAASVSDPETKALRGFQMITAETKSRTTDCCPPDAMMTRSLSFARSEIHRARELDPLSLDIAENTGVREKPTDERRASWRHHTARLCSPPGGCGPRCGMIIYLTRVRH
jgi:hypothetical protein